MWAVPGGPAPPHDAEVHPLRTPAGTVTPPRYDRTVPRFEVVTPLRPAGDQPRAIESADARASGAAIATRPCSASPAAGRRPPSPGPSSRPSGPPSSSSPTSPWPPSWPPSSRSSSPTTGSSTSCRTTTTTSPRRTCRPRTPTSRRTRRSTTRSTGCATPPPRACLLRRDVIVVASVSCIYGLGSPDEYRQRIMAVRPGDTVNQRDLLRKLVELHYDRNDAVLTRGHFRVRGDTVELHPVYEEQAVRIELFGDEVERIRRFDALTGDTGRGHRRARGVLRHPLRGRRRDHAARHRVDPDRARPAPDRAAVGGQAARGPAAAAADRARPRDAGRGRGVQRHRELQPAPRRAQRGGALPHACSTSSRPTS